MTNGEIVTKGTIGSAASFGAWLASHIQQINAFMQFGCLSLGFAISCLTLWKLVTKHKRTNDEK